MGGSSIPSGEFGKASPRIVAGPSGRRNHPVPGLNAPGVDPPRDSGVPRPPGAPAPPDRRPARSAEAATRSRPSGSSTTASSVRSPATTRAKAASGIMQPPSRSARTRRSATTARWVAGSSSAASRASVPPSSTRHSIPRAPLPHRRQETRRPEPFGDVPLQPEPPQPRLGQDHRVELAEQGLVQAGLDVPPDPHDLQPGPGVEELGPPTERAGARPSPRPASSSRVLDLGRDQGVGHVLASRGRPPGSSPRGSPSAGPSGCGPRPRRARRPAPAGSPW